MGIARGADCGPRPPVGFALKSRVFNKRDEARCETAEHARGGHVGGGRRRRDRCSARAVSLSDSSLSESSPSESSRSESSQFPSHIASPRRCVQAHPSRSESIFAPLSHSHAHTLRVIRVTCLRRVHSRNNALQDYSETRIDSDRGQYTILAERRPPVPALRARRDQLARASNRIRIRHTAVRVLYPSPLSEFFSRPAADQDCD